MSFIQANELSDLEFYRYGPCPYCGGICQQHFYYDREKEKFEIHCDHKNSARPNGFLSKAEGYKLIQEMLQL